MSARWFKHLFTMEWQVRRAFPDSTLATIEQAIVASEATHAGQICFAIEGALDSASLFAGQSASERALEVFSHLRVWDTEHNNGVLIYLLLADHDVEIVADRGIHGAVGAQEWEAICRKMEQAFAAKQYGEGAIAGINAITRHLSKHFPAEAVRRNEIPDRPRIL